MLRTKLELVFFKHKDWPIDWPNGYMARWAHFNLANLSGEGLYLFSGDIERKEGEIFTFHETYVANVDFPLIPPEGWEEVKSEIFVGKLINIHTGSKIIGKAKLLEYKYYESYDFVDGKVIVED